MTQTLGGTELAGTRTYSDGKGHERPLDRLPLETTPSAGSTEATPDPVDTPPWPTASTSPPHRAPSPAARSAAPRLTTTDSGSAAPCDFPELLAAYERMGVDCVLFSMGSADP
ncbi:hypothetical protein Ato02nite_019590 [Paractinoplanes toevensis]|uniref:Uncharacterized protein n=1 Tax=Paractinoplanes toevensis TaxID=571911 RepID=A0A919T8R5_9ACTN|nr:hypothetical protein Ato02nite_019590 [Actinoplanes toevensis]